jgi:hypothetical protein
MPNGMTNPRVTAMSATPSSFQSPYASECGCWPTGYALKGANIRIDDGSVKVSVACPDVASASVRQKSSRPMVQDAVRLTCNLI